MTTRLLEQGSLVEAKRSNGTFPVRIITEGKGSSAVYPREVLERYKDVFAGRPMFRNHPKDPNRPEERGIEGIIGRLGPVVEAREVDGVLGLYAEATIPDPQWAKFVEDYSDVIGVSVYIAGEVVEQGGERVLESFDGSDPYSSVDFVVAAGRGGRVERAMESLRILETSTEVEDGTATADADIQEDEVENMEELKASVAALAESVTALTVKVDSIVTLTESAAEASQDTVDAFAVAEELATAVAEANLPEVGRKRVIEAVKGGSAVAEAVAAEVAYVKAVTESVAASSEPVAGGRVVEGGTGFSLSKIAEVK